MKPLFFLFPILCLTGWLSAAQAAGVSNLDDKPQAIEMRVSSGYTEVVIEPGKTWRIPGKAVIRFHGREVRLEGNEEYAIWKDGTFGPQRLIGSNSNRLH